MSPIHVLEVAADARSSGRADVADSLLEEWLAFEHRQPHGFRFVFGRRGRLERSMRVMREAMNRATLALAGVAPSLLAPSPLEPSPTRIFRDAQLWAIVQRTAL